MDGVHANLESIEGTVSPSIIHTLKRRSKKIMITNDHATKALQYRFNASEDYATLNGTESLSLYFSTKRIDLVGDNVPYRLWVFG